jgi:hypothetical protein
MPKHTGTWVSYLRVSTDKQGKSGLGLEAQRKAVLDFLNGGKWQLAAEYVEVESGKRNDRPQLAAALAACKKLKARLVVASVGAGVSEKEARVGERVMDHHYDGCGTCKHCRAGWTQMCLEGPVVYGSGGHGGHARYMKVPVSTLVVQ